MNKSIDVEIKELEIKLKKLKEQRIIKDTVKLQEPFNFYSRHFHSLKTLKRSIERMERAFENSLTLASEDFFSFIRDNKDAILQSTYYINYLYWGTDFSVQKLEEALGLKTGELLKLAETSSDRVLFGLSEDVFYSIESSSSSGNISRWYRDNKFTVEGKSDSEAGFNYTPIYIKIITSLYDETFFIIKREFISDKEAKI